MLLSSSDRHSAIKNDFNDSLGTRAPVLRGNRAGTLPDAITHKTYRLLRAKRCTRSSCLSTCSCGGTSAIIASENLAYDMCKPEMAMAVIRAGGAHLCIPVSSSAQF